MGIGLSLGFPSAAAMAASVHEMIRKSCRLTIGVTAGSTWGAEQIPELPPKSGFV